MAVSCQKKLLLTYCTADALQARLCYLRGERREERLCLHTQRRRREKNYVIRRGNSGMASSLVKYNTPILVQQLKGGKKSKPKANGEYSLIQHLLLFFSSSFPSSHPFTLHPLHPFNLLHHLHTHPHLALSISSTSSHPLILSSSHPLLISSSLCIFFMLSQSSITS